jgi:rare lipoprotein A
MSSIACATDSPAMFASARRGRSPDAGVATAGPVLRVLAVALGAAALSACVPTPFAGQKFASRVERVAAPSRIEPVRPEVAARPAVAKKRLAALGYRPDAPPRDASTGLASYYRHGTKTASGEAFNPSELTAAHRTLPFGTRLRVTNVTTGQSVTVRVNDRGPFIPGRIVDVSHSAAEALGMTGAGLTKVKLDVVD